jgi:hypothetical protein
LIQAFGAVMHASACPKVSLVGQSDRFRSGPCRFDFFSLEEPRVHIHVFSPDGEAKFWIEPRIELATTYGIGRKNPGRTEELIRENENAIREAWHKHFGG